MILEMFRQWYFFSIILLASLLLIQCGSGSNRMYMHN